MRKSKTFPTRSQLFFKTLWKLSYDALKLIPSLRSVKFYRDVDPFIGTDGNSHTLGRSLGPIVIQLMLLSSARRDRG